MSKMEDSITMNASKDARIGFKLAKEGWSNIHGENVKSLSTVHEYEGYVETVDNAIPRGFITREEFDRAYIDQDISVGELARQCLIFMAENGNATHASGIMNDAMRIRTFLAVMQEKGVSEAQALPSGYGDRKIAATFWYLDNGTDEPYHVEVGFDYNNEALLASMRLNFNTEISDTSVVVNSDILPESVRTSLDDRIKKRSKGPTDKQVRISDILTITGMNVDSLSNGRITESDNINNQLWFYNFEPIFTSGRDVIQQINRIMESKR